MATDVDDGAAYRCRWCRNESAPTGSSCPHCGAPVDVTDIVSDSGWTEMPAIPDLAKIQFGASSCQIEGQIVPVADMNLAAGDAVYFNHHVLLWREPAVELDNMPLRGGLKRLRAGMPVFLVTATGPGHIAFSHDHAGEVVAVPLAAGQEIDVHEHHFLCATTSIGFDYFNTNIWFRTRSGDETETHYPLGMYMDRFVAVDSHGLLLLHAKGNLFIRELAQNDWILIKPTALLYKDPSVGMALHFEAPSNQQTWSYSRKHVWLRLWGPGRVAVQSAPHHVEGTAGNIVGNSDHTTVKQW